MPETIVESTPEDILAARLAAFQKAAKDHGLTDEERYVETPEQAEPGAEDVHEEEQLGQEADEQEVDDEAYRRAVAALLRSGFDQPEINAMDKAKVLERGQKRHQILARDDAAYESLRDLIGSSKETSEKSKEPAKPEPAGVPAIDFEKLVTPFVETYGLDDDAAKAFAKVIKDAVSPLASELSAIRREDREGRQGALLDSVTKARKGVGVRYPGLTDEKTFTKVVARMVSIGNEPAYAEVADPDERIKKLMEDASFSLHLSEKKEEPSTPSRVVTRTGTKPPTAGKKIEPHELTERERKWQVFQHLQKHPGDVDGARRATAH